ncbi:MAG: aldose epimerase family protein, partial [Bacteroidota bacterium]
MKFTTFCMILFSLALTNCQPSTETEESTEEPATKSLSIQSEKHGMTKSGIATLYTLENANGVKMKVSTYGGTLTELYVPDRDGNLADITLGFDTLSSYEGEQPFFGAIVGRYGNRIAKGKFEIDGETYTLATNNGANSLHGGVVGFNKKIWEAKTIEEENQVGLELSYMSPDMEEGFPGNLKTIVRYFLNNDNEWIIEYEATTDKKTTVNLTQHAYFNLNGVGNDDILGHEVTINADHYTPVDETLIPTGELATVEGTPFDFRTSTAVGARVKEENQQLKYGSGYDHNWVINRPDDQLMVAATVYAPESGRFMEVLTTEPGIQFYTGNFLNGENIGKGDQAYLQHAGLCLETQHYPDSPNIDHFPSTILSPKEKYSSKT